jgi:hypothetical protein
LETTFRNTVMAEKLLTLRLEPQVEFALSTLDPNPRRIMGNWFEGLRRWHTDDFVRSRSQKLKPDEEVYAFQSDASNLIFVFSIQGDEATVLSIFTKETLEQFRRAMDAVA